MNLVSTVNLSNEKDYQSIYSTQIYGTFFAIYAKFTLSDTDKDYYTLEKIDLVLVNYKGLINIGLTECEYKYNEDSKSAILKVEVRALHKNKKLEVDCGNKKFKRDGTSVLDVDRRVLPMKGGKTMENEVFDEEFYYREGVENPKNMKEGSDYDFEVDSKKRSITPDTLEFNAQEASDGGKKCPKARNLMM